jgi:hypothetical protein
MYFFSYLETATKLQRTPPYLTTIVFPANAPAASAMVAAISAKFSAVS